MYLMLKNAICTLRTLGKEEEAGGDGQEKGRSPCPSRGGEQGQEGKEGFHDT